MIHLFTLLALLQDPVDWSGVASRKIEPVSLKTPGGHVPILRFAPEGDSLLSMNQGGTILLWDLATHVAVSPTQARGLRYLSLQFAPEGGLVGLAKDREQKRVNLVAVATGKTVSCYEGQTGAVASLSPDLKLVVCTEMDGAIRLWEGKTGKQLHHLTGHKAFVNFLLFRPDGKVLLSGDYVGRWRLWEVSSGEEVCPIEFPARPAAAFSPDGKHLAIEGKEHEILLLDAATGKEVCAFAGHTLGVHAFAFSPEGGLLASGGSDHKIELWDVAGRKRLRELSGHERTVESLAFRPNGKLLASGDEAGKIQLWPLRD